MDASLPPANDVPPTPFPAPPVILPPSPPPPPRKSRGWMMAAIALCVLLGISLLFNFGQMVSSVAKLSPTRTRVGGPRLEEIMVEDHDSRDKIAVVPIEGIISGARVDGTGYNMVDVVKEQLRRADEDNRVAAVILKVDSPGGEVLASDEIAKAIRRFQEESRKPVVVSMGNLAASGGYYVSAPCRYIVANDLTITGSIGVIMSGLNYRGLMDKIGLRPMVFKSGRFKDMLSGSRSPEEIPAEEKQMMQHLIYEVYGKFTNVVAQGRAEAHKANGKEGRELAADWTDYADGRVLSGAEALKLGFVDELGGFDKAVSRAAKIAGVRRPNVVEYRPIVELADLLRLFGKTEAKPLKVDLGVELPKLKAGQPYFLYDTGIY
ncbi:MAG TPA: signal peptide peptidase SppA [Verrucomicrobiae bacterium]|nr:signal peptide peptidase SppA [Verrucomicrobiae bacterium]